MWYINSPRGVTNNRLMGPKPTSQKTEFTSGQVKDTEDRFNMA